MRKHGFLSALMVLALAACGGGEDAFQGNNGGGGGGGASTSTPAAVSLTSNVASIPGDGSASATITALVLDSSNVVVANAPVTFSTTSGALSAGSMVTGSNGAATATLSTGGDPTPRNITVSAKAGSITSTVVVKVGGTATTAPVAALTLTTSGASIDSDGLTPATITAYVRDASNQFMANVPVTFSSNSGGLVVDQSVTNANGQARATLSTAGDPSNRAITVTAQAGAQTATIAVNVGGSALSVQGATALTLNQQGTYRVVLVDSGNHPISGRALTVTSQRGNTLSATALTTDSNGAATFRLTAVNSGADTITVRGLGLTATQSVSVNTDSVTFTPVANPEVGLSPATQQVEVTWLSNGVPVVGQNVVFSTTRGTIGTTSVTTLPGGIARTTVSATTAGSAVITATAGSSSATLPLEFVAATPASIDVQASPFSIGPNETSTLTATVRDAAGNLVKNKVVVFTLTDVTGGTLSVGSATTDSQGKAQTVYTASSATSASQGVKISAALQGSAITPSQIGLTVARRQVFISIGTGNTITEPNTAQYKVEYVIQLTDANGNGVAGVPVTLRMLSARYYKGFRVAGLSTWSTSYTTPGGASLTAGGCLDEDTNHNGVLDPNEDNGVNGNNNQRLEAGNIVTITPTNGVTDSNGFILAQIYYPQEFAYYLTVDLSASSTVAGTEYVRTNTFMLAGSSVDFSDLTVTPPGPTSPFGVATTCSDPR